MTDTSRKEASSPRPATTAAPRPATTVLLLRPSKTGDAGSALEFFMVVRHHQIDSFSGALVFPGGKLEESDGDPRLRARCGGSDKISADELKFRVAGVREAFEECGVLLARKRGQRSLIAAADLKAIEQKWRAKLTKDEASIIDLVEAEDQVALHDGSESVDSVWITPEAAMAEAKAGKRTLVHATTKNLELLAEGKTAVGALAHASERKIVTVQPWVETREGKRFLHIPEGAGYRNLVREMPPQTPPQAVPQAGR